MITFDIRRIGSKYGLVERNFDGIETQYKIRALLTADEAQALIECDYVTGPPGQTWDTTSSVSPEELISIESDLSRDTTRQLLYLTLPEDPRLPREEMRLLDPWYTENHKILKQPKWDRFRKQTFLDDSLVEEQVWPDNPTEAVAFW